MASDKDAVMEDDSAATRARSMAVRAAILAEDARIRAKFPLLLAVSAQSGVALAIWIGSLVVMTGAAAGYLRGVIPAWVVIPVSAFAASLLHELEHDLIHNLYFQKLPFIQDVMFFGIWVAKLSINPWTRRGYHLHHHRRSGQPDDYEERLIGLGISNLPYRIALAVAPWTIALVTKKIEKDSGGKYHTLRGTPCSAERWLQRVDLFFVLSPTLAALAAAYGSKLALTFLVVWAGPNVLRHACIVLMSSYSHYYGDVTPGDVNQQNQILNHWTLLPFQVSDVRTRYC